MCITKYEKILLAPIVLLSLTISCSDENYFDKDAYDKLVTEAFPVGNFDATHDWKTIDNAEVNIVLSQSVEGNSTIRIYDSNPTVAGARLLAKQTVASGKTMTTNVNYKIASPTVYVMVTSADGAVGIYPCPIENGQVNATVGDAQTATNSGDTNYSDTIATLRYCFEENYPMVGDFDFNDCVLDITPELDATINTRVRYTVSLVALGASQQIGAALRLKGVRYSSDIARISISGDLNTYSTSNFSYDILTSKFNAANYVKGSDNNVVIYLFNDGHYAFTHNMKTSIGGVYRPYINTIRKTDTAADCIADIAPVTCEIIVDFTSSIAALEAVRVSVIDPFIVTEYNGGNWETHTIDWKTDPALFTFDNTNDYDINLPWAICMSGSFKYAKESVAVGSDKAGVLGGAYQTLGHSFAEWCEDKNTATDWYLYPESDKIYR